MDKSELAKKICNRVEQCRRLARYVNDPRTTATLLQMADEGEADLRRLEEEGIVPGSMIDGMAHAKMNPPLN